MEKGIKTYSGIILLDKIFEFTAMTPNPAEWNVKSLKANPPRRIRLQQIESLLKAFCGENKNEAWVARAKSLLFDDKKITITSFLKGDFIKDRAIEEYSEAARFIKEFVKAEEPGLINKREINLGELVFIFPQLIDFKRQIRSILTFNSGWLEANSEVALFSIYLTKSIARNLVDKYEQLDYVLEQLINPRALAYTEQELIDKFNFPTENLEDIDSDFM